MPHLHPLRLFIVLAMFLYVMPVHAELSLDIKTPVLAADDSIVDIEDLRDRIRNIDEHMNDEDLSNVISSPFTFISKQITPKLVSECGQKERFMEFFDAHGFKPYTLEKTEREFLRTCMYNVFEFADEELGFAAPGLYRRVLPDYIDAGIEMGYRCGYRTQKSFSIFSLFIWLVHMEDIEGYDGFGCLGDFPATVLYHEITILSGTQVIVDDLLFYYTVFGNWADAQRYFWYIERVSENKRIGACREIIQKPFEDEEVNKALLKSNECNDLPYQD